MTLALGIGMLAAGGNGEAGFGFATQNGPPPPQSMGEETVAAFITTSCPSLVFIFFTFAMVARPPLLPSPVGGIGIIAAGAIASGEELQQLATAVEALMVF